MRFMLKLTLNRPAFEEITARLPAEKDRGKELEEQGIREAVFIAVDRSTVWTVWNCVSRDALDETARSLPLFQFWDIEVTQLADDDF